MPDINRKIFELRKMDELAETDSPIHSLHPLAKLIVTVVYILATASFPKYDLSGLAAMMLYPAVLFAVSGIPVKVCVYKMRFVLPLVCAVGIFNPFFDRETLLSIGSVNVSGGVVSMVTLMIKGVLCLTAAFLLAATTSVDAICAALRKLRVPEIVTTLLLLTYRYLTVMAEEVAVMVTAYQLRAPGQRGLRFPAWGSFLGQLILRSTDKAQEIYSAMLLRGFGGEFRYADPKAARAGDFIFGAVSVLLIVVCRLTDLAEMIGSAIV